MLACIIATMIALAGEPTQPSTAQAARTLSHFAVGQVPDSPTVVRALATLREEGDPQDLPLLMSLRQDESGRVRLHAREAAIAIRRRAGEPGREASGAALVSTR